MAWELSWYQFGVDLSDGREPVRLRGQGQELSELPEEAQDWNCEVARRTAARLGRARRTPAAERRPTPTEARGEPRSGPYSD